MSAEIPTPRTDAFIKSGRSAYISGPFSEFARELERELIALEAAAMLAREALDSVANQVHSIKISTNKGKNISRCETIISQIEEALAALDKVLPEK